jgi:hypothetical protein
MNDNELGRSKSARNYVFGSRSNFSYVFVHFTTLGGKAEKILYINNKNVHVHQLATSARLVGCLRNLCTKQYVR